MLRLGKEAIKFSTNKITIFDQILSKKIPSQSVY